MTCTYCGHPIGEPFEYRGVMMTLYAHGDHLVPSSAGGADDPANRVVSCVVCNTFKGAQIFASIGTVQEACRAFWAAPEFDPTTVQRAIERQREGCRDGARHQSRAVLRAVPREVKVRGGLAAQARRTPQERTEGSRAANHLRWHVNRGTINPRCSLCHP